MARVVGAWRVPTRASSALALVLAALVPVNAPASAQTRADEGGGSPTAPIEPAPSDDAPIAPILLPDEAAPVIADAEVAERPAETAVWPDLLAVPNVPTSDEVVLAQGPVADALPSADEITPGDPFERTNRSFFKVQSSIDRRFFRPVSQAYQQVVPKPVRSGLRNIIRNLTQPIVFVNDLLQLRPGRAVRTLGRFAINSTVGLGGAIDVAKSLDLPYRSNGFGNTLGRYGVGPGPYLNLPLIGPTTLRDLLGGQIDGLALPVGVGFPFSRLDYQLSSTVVSTLDKRAEAESDLQALLSGAADPYATLRSVYLQSREAAIADARGKPLDLAPLDDPLDDPANPASIPNVEASAGSADDGAGSEGAEPMFNRGDGTADPVETTPTDPVAPPPAPLLTEAAADY